MKTPALVTVIPVGPGYNRDFLCDTIESVRHHVSCSNVIVLVDDSGSGEFAGIADVYDNVDVIVQDATLGLNAGLYLSLSRAFIHILEKYRPDVVLRLDVDALVIGANPQRAAMDHFRKNPDDGIAGSFQLDRTGRDHDFGPPERMLRYDLRLRRLLQDPFHRWKGWRFLRKIRKRALENGYEPGEHCLGGAYFISRECLQRLSDAGMLDRTEIAWSRLQEDHLFGLFVRAIGMQNGDMASVGGPFAVRWRGLPDHPLSLLESGKKITHSTKFYKNMSEAEIRSIFRNARLGRSAR